MLLGKRSDRYRKPFIETGLCGDKTLHCPRSNTSCGVSIEMLKPTKSGLCTWFFHTKNGSLARERFLGRYSLMDKAVVL